MRLINCETYQLEEFLGGEIPPYAILSHTWGADEITYLDFTHHQAAVRAKKRYRKIKYTWQQSLRNEG
jgi:hypoxanthine phosphoribosyltransferase